jgi:hypothetical protein
VPLNSFLLLNKRGIDESIKPGYLVHPPKVNKKYYLLAIGKLRHFSGILFET